MNAQVIALVNQKGGVGKSTSCVNLGVGLAQAGKKVLIVDCDPQASLTISLGHPQPDTLPVTLSDVMGKILTDQPITPGEGILHHSEGVDLMPSDIQLSGMEVSLVNAMSRETILRQYLDTVRKQYTHILLDCQPSLGMLTVNALAAANRLVIPVQAEYLPAKGLEQLLQTVAKVRRQLNPKLLIDGILLTMVDSRTNFAKEISTLLRDTYIEGLKADMKTLAEHPHPTIIKEIPVSTPAAEGQTEGAESAEPAKPAVAKEVSQGFAGMVIKGTTYEDREAAGAALLEACKEVKDTQPVMIGSYRGFTMSVSISLFKHQLALKGEMTHEAEMGVDPRGNLLRIDHALDKMPDRLTAVEAQLDNLFAQRDAAKAEVGKPFPQEDELREKSARLAELDAMLNIDGGHSHEEQAIAKSARPSVLDGLKRPAQPGPDKKVPKAVGQEL